VGLGREVAATLQVFEERAAEVNTHMGSLAAVRALQRSAGTSEDDIHHPWPLMVSISVH
jgi:hypothetical protein